MRLSFSWTITEVSRLKEEIVDEGKRWKVARQSFEAIIWRSSGRTQLVVFGTYNEQSVCIEALVESVARTPKGLHSTYTGKDGIIKREAYEENL